jgi:hypothetical protein
MPEPACRSSTNRETRSGYVLHPDVVFIPTEDGTAQLLDLDGSAFFLSETASKMLKGVLERGEADTLERIAAEHNTNLDGVRADLSALLANLRARGLVRRGDERLHRMTLRSVIAISISFPTLKILRFVRDQRLKALALLVVARLCFLLAGWARTVDAWRKCLNISQVRALDPDRETLIDTIDSAIRDSANNLIWIACKERALCGWFMLRSAGVPATLVLGVRFSPFSGHCWCELGERILTDSPENCEGYMRVVRYDA